MLFRGCVQFYVGKVQEMSFLEWTVEAEIYLKRLKAECPCESPCDNVILPAVPKDQMSWPTLSGVVREMACEFYDVCDGLYWPDVWNGYFLKRASEIGTPNDRFDPTYVVTDSSFEITTIGSTGGGGLFALLNESGRVAFLPNARIEENKYFDDDRQVRIVAGSLREFAHLLLSDLRCYVEDTRGHQFLDGGENTQ